jgi:serine/threonine-protein kinase
MHDLTGRTLKDRYRIKALIGRGGMADVYKAWDTRRQHDVAIKVMREDLAEDPEFVRRFQREAEALAALSHANIVRFYSFEREGPLAFIVMDYVEGTTLRRRILEGSGQPLPLDETVGIVQQVCAALHYAHAEGVLHRDIKPGNIMLQTTPQTGEGPQMGTTAHVLVADFGIAKAADSATLTIVMPGTPAYMSPEQCRSQPLDARTDVYSLGVVVYEMLAGRRPFLGDTPTTTGSTRERLRWEQMHANPPPLRRLNPGVPAEVEEVVLRALAKDREARWPTALAFWQALAHALGAPEPETETVVLSPQPETQRMHASTPKPARPPGAAPIAQPESQAAARPAVGRRGLPPWAWVAGGVLLAAVVGLSLALLGGIPVDRQPTATAAAQVTPAPATTSVSAPPTAATGATRPAPSPTQPPTPSPTQPPTGVPTATQTQTARPTHTASPTPAATASPLPSATATPAGLSLGDTWTRPQDGMVMVYVPGGALQMGSSDQAVEAALALCADYRSDCQRGWFEDQQPAHSVSLKGFWIDWTEVTNAQFASFLNERANPVEGRTTWLDLEDENCLIEAAVGRFQPKSGFDTHPVVEVTWHGAAAYCAWVGGQLPTEAEWEYAARGVQGRAFPWGETFDGSRTNYCDVSCGYDWADDTTDDGYGWTAPVGSFAGGTSWCGASDLAGNVWEWTASLYAAYPYQDDDGRNDPDPSGMRVLRGGSWINSPDYVRGATRVSRTPDETHHFVGFRCAKDSP